MKLLNWVLKEYTLIPRVASIMGPEKIDATRNDAKKDKKSYVFPYKTHEIGTGFQN
jgi:hypothetical protein